MVLVLAPWNYPFGLALSPVVAALAAGNTVMLRPSEKTPRTARFIRDLLGRVFPENEVAVLVGDRAVADALLELPFDHILFTGSAAVGRKVMAAAARHLTPVTLELGGKSPAIVDETADIDAAAERLAWAKFINAGQTCLAPDYVLVHEAVRRPARGGPARRRRAVLREPTRRPGCATPISPAWSTPPRSAGSSAPCRRRWRVAPGWWWVAGSTCRRGACRPRCWPTWPTTAPSWPRRSSARCCRCCATATSARPSGACRAGRSRSALYVFSRSNPQVEEVLGATSAGGTCVNNAVLHYANPHLPFGGVGESGTGNYHGRWGFEALSHSRAVLRQVTWASTSLLYPPYTPKVAGFLKLLRRLVG